MKNVKGILISLILIILAAGLFSCQENNSVISNDDQTTVIEDLKVQIIDYTPASIEFASFYNEMKLYKTEFKKNYHDCSGIFSGMQLEENKVSEIRQLFVEQQYTVEDILSEISNIETKAVENANRDRREIIEKVNNDLMDTEIAKSLIRQLNIITQNQIMESIYNLENKVFSKRREWTIKVGMSLDEQHALAWKDYTMSNYKIFNGEIY